MIRVAIVHPSFGRPELALKCANEWYTKADRRDELEYTLALNDNDPSIAKYVVQAWPLFGRFRVDIGDSSTASQAMNRAVKRISNTTELIMVVADDQGCPDHWDSELKKVLSGIDNFRKPVYIYVSDGLSDMDKDEGPKYAYINRAFYEKLGFLQHPDYHSLYADNDLFECAKILGMIRAPHLIFEHRHHSRSEGKWDDTYWRTNNLEAVAQGQRVFAERKARNFDL